MSGFAIIAGIIILLFLAFVYFVSSLSTAICIIFAIFFWGSLAILVGGLLIWTVLGIVYKDRKRFSSIAEWAFIICILGLLAALVIFLVAVVIDFFRFLGAGMNLTHEKGIELRHLFFPWER